jgi:hypothetical protein
MSHTNVTTNLNELHKIWLCNECLGKFFIAGFYAGLISEIETDAVRNTSINLSGGGINVTGFMSRNYRKTTTWEDLTFSPHTYITTPEQVFQTSWDNIADDCWGVPEREFNGSYSVSSEWKSGEIYYADLREDILVYYQESGGHSAGASGDKPLGRVLGYASWNGGEPACRGADIYDAIKLPLEPSSRFYGEEIITLGGYKPYNYRRTESSSFNVAAADQFSTVFDMAVIDESKPYSCKDGVYEELIVHERIDGYSNSWDTCGHFTAMDGHDASNWYGSFVGEGVNHIADGTYDYPSFINIDPMPHGSFVTDHEGNYFHSMVTRDMKTFNRLNTADPNGISELPGSGVVFYPVAPA